MSVFALLVSFRTGEREKIRHKFRSTKNSSKESKRQTRKTRKDDGGGSRISESDGGKYTTRDLTDKIR